MGCCICTTRAWDELHGARWLGDSAWRAAARRLPLACSTSAHYALAGALAEPARAAGRSSHATQVGHAGQAEPMGCARCKVFSIFFFLLFIYFEIPFPFLFFFTYGRAGRLFWDFLFLLFIYFEIPFSFPFFSSRKLFKIYIYIYIYIYIQKNINNL
jgi:hypothetical protein